MAPPSPAELRKAETFPTLAPAQIARIRSAGHERTFHPGEILFEQGEAATRFFVILEGSVEIGRASCRERV